MLKGMRKSAKQILWPLIIALVITMGGYGVWYLIQPEEAESRVGVIWGEKITLEDFSQTYRTARAFTALSGGQLDQKELFRLTWQRIILQREAEKMGISTTRGELARALAGFRIFQVEGKFNPDRYHQIIRRSFQMEDSTFEEQMMNILSIEKLQALIQNQALISTGEIDRTYQRLNEKIRVDYIQVLKDPFSDPIEIPEAELSEYYEQNQSRFQVQTRVEIEYITINRASFKDTVLVSPEEIEARYQETKASFTDETEEQASLDEIKDEIRQELTDEKCEDKAGALAQKINTTFVEDTSLSIPAEEFSLPIKKSGYFTMDEAIPGLGENSEINRMAFTMEIDEIVSYPVPTEEGFVFFKVTKKDDSHLRPFEDAKSEVLTILNEELTNEETLKVARDELTELRELMDEEEFDFESAAEELDLTIESTPLFTREGDDSLPSSASFIQAAFLTPPGEVSNLIPIEAGYVFLTVGERVPADPMPEDEKEDWEILTRRGKARLVYDSWFNNLIQKSKFSIINKELAP